MRFRNHVCLFCLAVLFSPLFLVGQSFLGSITGTVQDQSGAVIPNAGVTLNNVNTGQQFHAVTNSAGIYLFADVLPGVYTVTVLPPTANSGFSQARSGNMTLIAAEHTRFDVKLQVGSATAQTVSVSAAPPALNTEDGLVSHNVSHRELETIPIGQQTAIGGMLMLESSDYVSGSSKSIGGGRDTNINWTVDGVTAKSALFGNQQGSMPAADYDTIETLKVETSNSSAEYQDPSSVFVSERTGTNIFHGSLFYYENNWAMNATPYFGTSKPKGPIQHMFGGTVGGPVILPHYNGRDKTFFFASYQGWRTPGTDVMNAQVPTAAMMGGDFSALLPSVVITDPSTGQPFSGNVIPPGRISSVAKNLQQFGFLAPNHMSTFAAGYDWVGIEPNPSGHNQYTGRVDHNFGDKDRLFGRWSFGDYPVHQYTTSLPLFKYIEDRTENNGMLGETHTFSASLLNEFRLGFSRDAANYGDSHPDGVALTQSLGLQEPYLAQKAGLPGFPEVSFTNYNPILGKGEQFWRSQTTEWLDNVTWMKGKNQFKFGVDFLKNYINKTTCCTYDFGQMSFDGFATGYDYADFLLGIPHSSGLGTRNRPVLPGYNHIGLYALDNLQLTPRLTVNIGLRWDYQTPPAERNGQSYDMDLANGDLVLPNQKAQSILSPAFTSSLPNIQYEIAPIPGYPVNSLFYKHPNNWGPRVSFAYRPFSDDRTVIRGGYGLYYSTLTYTLLTNVGQGPFDSNQSFLNTITNGVPALSLPEPFLATGGVGIQSVAHVNPTLPFPRSHQWNFTVEHELPGSVVVQLDYRGIRTQQIPYAGDWNRPHPSTNPANEKIYTYPEYSTVKVVQPGADQNLNAMDVQVSRHFANGLDFESSYTLARNLSDDTSIEEGDDSNIENPYDLQRDWGKLGYMPTQRSVTYFVYNLPFGSGQRFASALPTVLDRIIGGWEMSSVFNFQSGMWLTPSFSKFDPSNTRLFGGRPDQIGQWRISGQSNKRWFNPAAFAIPGCPTTTPVCKTPAAVGRFGTATNGTIEGPGVANVDFGLFKDFTTFERLKFRVGAEAFNVLNHPNFGNPNTNISATAVGTITGISGTAAEALGGNGARTLEVQGRLEF